MVWWNLAIGLLMVWLAVVLVVLLLVLWWLPIQRFRRCGVKHLTPVPLFGDMTRIVFKKQQIFDNHDRIYKAFPEERFIGFVEFIKPVVFVRDLELAKKILLTDYQHFQDHSAIVDKNIDTLFGGGLFALKGQEWKDMRRMSSTAFTTFKLKHMTDMIKEVGDRMFSKIEKIIKESEKNYYEVDFDETCVKYTFEAVASSCFGMKLDLEDPANAEFYNKGKEIANMKFRQLLNFFGYQATPKLMKILRVSMFSKSLEDYFRKLMDQIMKERVAQQIYRPDVIDVLLKARNEYSDDQLLGQAVLVFIAGLEPTSAALSMLVLEMARHPEVQEKLAKEILQQDSKCGGNADYDVIEKMTYLDMVVSELLRLRVGSFSDRVCSKDYNLGRPNDSVTEDYIIRKGETVYVSFRSFHLDPKYFPDPDRFDPERFSPENRHKFPAFAYNPFGAGPRICMGNRFTIFLMKMMIYNFLLRVRILPFAQTSKQVRLSSDSVVLRNQDGYRVRLELRE